MAIYDFRRQTQEVNPLAEGIKEFSQTLGGGLMQYGLQKVQQQESGKQQIANLKAADEIQEKRTKMKAAEAYRLQLDAMDEDKRSMALQTEGGKQVVKFIKEIFPENSLNERGEYIPAYPQEVAKGMIKDRQADEQMKADIEYDTYKKKEEFKATLPDTPQELGQMMYVLDMQKQARTIDPKVYKETIKIIGEKLQIILKGNKGAQSNVADNNMSSALYPNAKDPLGILKR